MAKYDHGGGCPCGLYAECECDRMKKAEVRHDMDAHELSKAVAANEHARRLERIIDAVIDMRPGDNIRRVVTKAYVG